MAKKTENNIPPRPAMDPEKGDKTPALVEWLAKYAPEEFSERYGRGEGLRGGTAIAAAQPAETTEETPDQ